MFILDMSKKYNYFLVYKPYNFLSQFTKELPHLRSLQDLGSFPKDCYPVGRLDKDSEGLLIITNDTSLNKNLLDPALGHKRKYLVQVEGTPTEDALEILRRGVTIKLKNKNYETLPCSVTTPNQLEWIKNRVPPIRYRVNQPTSWWSITLTEGKNRQVRKMFAKIGTPVLRLIRSHIEAVSIMDFEIGEVRNMEKESIYSLLKI